MPKEFTSQPTTSQVFLPHRTLTLEFDGEKTDSDLSSASSPDRQLDSEENPDPDERPAALQPPLFLLPWITGGICTLLLLVAMFGGPTWSWLVVIEQMLAALVGGYLCYCALNHAQTRFSAHIRLGWILVGVSAVLCAAGNFSYLFVLHTRPTPVPSVADVWWVLQQPALGAGLLLLAWRGRNRAVLGMMADALIVVLAAVVLSWSLLIEKKLLNTSYGNLAKLVAIYYPLFDVVQLFCVLMLVANVRKRCGMVRAAAWLLVGVVALIAGDSLNAFFFFSRHVGQLFTGEFLQQWSYPLIGLAALVHARGVVGETPLPKAEGDESEKDESLLERIFVPGSRLAEWEPTVTRLHRMGLLWLPYIATLIVSAVLIIQEIQRSNIEVVQRVLPVLALMLAIVARQMITMWDNLHLAEQLRSSNLSLERNVDERTRHLATLHGITSTLNTSLDRRTVLRVTLEKTIMATHAEAGGIWLREMRRDIYTDGVPSDEWMLMNWQGVSNEPAHISMLRDLSIAAAEAENGSDSSFHLSPATREAITKGLAPPAQKLITVPVRWQGALLGVMGMMRGEGEFSYEDRALVESIALEAGTALQNARLYSEAAHRADRDSVTDLLNHRAVQEHLNNTLASAKRTGEVFSILMMDLNNFKFFNDTYGHPVGDDVLRAVSHSLHEACRRTDILGRYGGDEFIVLLPATDSEGAMEACQRIKKVLDERHFEPVPGTRLPIGVAIGCATYPEDGSSTLDLLTTADQNLYDHKRGGNPFLSQRGKAIRESREELRHLKDRSVGGSFGVLDALVTAIDNKDQYTRHHSEEVTYLSLMVARELSYPADFLQAVRISGLLHDVGKIAVPDDILRHPGKLGGEEWEIMQQHPVFGALIVKDVPHLDLVLQGIRHHHERWDGSGYPDGLSAEAIPFMGRLLAPADCYSALTTDRPYRKGWKPEAALEEIQRCSGSHFDPRLCATFLKVMRRELASLDHQFNYGARISGDFGESLINLENSIRPLDSTVASMAPIG